MMVSTSPKFPAQAKIELAEGLSLLFRATANDLSGYPSARIQKGLLLLRGNSELSEEGVGFGLPIIKTEFETIFPGEAQIRVDDKENVSRLIVDYTLNLRETLKMGDTTIQSQNFYRLQDRLGYLHRTYPALRGTGVALSNLARRICGLKSCFEAIPSGHHVNVIYTVQTGRKNVNIDVEFKEIRRRGKIGITVANEQGANFFDAYKDSSGIIMRKNRIGTWDEISAGEARLIDSANQIFFSLRKVPGASFFRGRELVPDRLAWSGLNYVLSDHADEFHYNIEIGAPK